MNSLINQKVGHQRIVINTDKQATPPLETLMKAKSLMKFVRICQS